MTTSRDLERQLRDHFDAHADRTVLDGQLASIRARTVATRQRPRWQATLRSVPMSATTAIARPAVPRVALALVVLGLLILLALAALASGTIRLPRPVPLNGLIAFGRMDAAQGDTVPYVIDPDGSHERRLTTETHEGAAWSPDGSTIRFADGSISADGSGWVAIPPEHGTFNVPCGDWSPDGQWCLGEGWDDTDAARDGVYLVSVRDPSSYRQLTHHRDIPGGFSHDGTRIAFSRDGLLWVMDVDGSNARQLGFVTTSFDYTWAHDDASILFTSGGTLARVDVASGQITPIRIADAPESQVVGVHVSPDGTRLVLQVQEGIQADSSDLFTVRAGGTDLVRLTNTPEDERSVSWGTHPLDR